VGSGSCVAGFAVLLRSCACVWYVHALLEVFWRADDPQTVIRRWRGCSAHTHTYHCLC
jgi:hypothetical protein